MKGLLVIILSSYIDLLSTLFIIKYCNDKLESKAIFYSLIYGNILINFVKFVFHMLNLVISTSWKEKKI